MSQVQQKQGKVVQVQPAATTAQVQEQPVATTTAQVQEQPVQVQVQPAATTAQVQEQPAQDQVVVQTEPQVVNNSPKQMFKRVVKTLTPKAQQAAQRGIKVVQQGMRNTINQAQGTIGNIKTIPAKMQQLHVNQVNKSVREILKNTKFQLCMTPNETATQQGGGRRKYKKHNRTKKHRKSKKHKTKKYRKSKKHNRTKKRTRKRKY